MIHEPPPDVRLQQQEDQERKNLEKGLMLLNQPMSVLMRQMHRLQPNEKLVVAQCPANE